MTTTSSEGKWPLIKDWIRSGKFLIDERLALTLWFGLSFFAVLAESIRYSINNYIIFKHVFIHTVQQINLYAHYPGKYEDVNLYGPFFSLVIAPFSFLPNRIGVILWVMMTNATFLYAAIRHLPLSRYAQNAILILSSHEMMNTASWLQSNAIVCACIILTFTSLKKDKEIWAAFFMLFAAFIKIYGIVGLAFFFFSKRPLHFIFWCLVWGIVFFIAPMLITKPSIIVQSYFDWAHALIVKDARNVRM
jgi:hypothetical protein